MKEVGLTVAFLAMFVFTACAPTVATKSIEETTHPDGRKTITVTRSFSQSVSVRKLKSTKDILEEFDR